VKAITVAEYFECLRGGDQSALKREAHGVNIRLPESCTKRCASKFLQQIRPPIAALQISHDDVPLLNNKNARQGPGIRTGDFEFQVCRRPKKPLRVKAVAEGGLPL
jgi:hypothetical protein